jgi:hypothetical protein
MTGAMPNLPPLQASEASQKIPDTRRIHDKLVTFFM